MFNRNRDRIDKYINRQLMVLERGKKLPSVRTIMQECQSSQSTVQAVLRQYEEKQLIISSNRRGYFKAERTCTPDHIEEIDLIYCTTAQNEDPLMKFHGEFSHLLGRFCGEKWRSVRMHFFESHADLNSLRQLACNTRCRACIVVATPNNEVGKILEECHVAYVNVFPEMAQPDPYSVNIVIDNEQAIDKSLGHLMNLGHRRIAYLHNLRENEFIRDLSMRKEIFYRRSLEHALPLNPEWVQFGGYDSDTCIDAMVKILSTNPRPTSVICSDHHLPAIYRLLNDYKMIPGHDFSVMSTDNLPIARIMSPQATSLDISRSLAARLAIDALEKTLAGVQVEHMMSIDSEVIIRQSTGLAPVDNIN
ncbi:MAG: substrate-binding domain-containing protein [Victivallales bacterium]|nr:substrate-binding domain-containing protein [Victivallales bacterium]